MYVKSQPTNRCTLLVVDFDKQCRKFLYRLSFYSVT